MSRYIDQDALCEFARHSTIGIDANDIMRFPSIEIIRCKDCKYYFIGNCMNTDVPIYADNEAEFMPDSDFYCSYGERRESE